MKLNNIEYKSIIILKILHRPIRMLKKLSLGQLLRVKCYNIFPHTQNKYIYTE